MEAQSSVEDTFRRVDHSPYVRRGVAIRHASAAPDLEHSAALRAYLRRATGARSVRELQRSGDRSSKTQRLLEQWAQRAEL